MAVTSLLLGNTQHGLGKLAGVSFPATVVSLTTNQTVAYSPNDPGIYVAEQTLVNNAAHNVRYAMLYARMRASRLPLLMLIFLWDVVSPFLSFKS